MLSLFDTAEGRVVPIEFRDPGKVSMYVCGPTVYGPAHLGHGRFSLVFDILRRYLEWSGYEVTYVSNITDIDDNIIKRANEEGRTTDEVVEEYERLWYEAMDAIGVKRPTIDPHATAYVDGMIELITELVATGYAYETDDGVYFTPDRIDDYGLLNHQSADSLRAGARVEVDDQKKSPIDFALWKKSKPGEPQWVSPWGPGRPGWHTECVVMSLDLLGDGFDIHGGAIDLIFPHHENERAQALASGRRFARHWVHNGFLEVGGQKMSKSLGNFTTLMDLVESTDARAYRLLVLRSHYRSPMEVDRENTADATKALETLDTFARRSADWPTVTPDPTALDEFRAAMDDDLDTPKAIGQLFTLVRRANQAADGGDIDGAAPLAAAVQEIGTAVGLELRAGVGEIPEDILELARQRDDARAAKEWGTADRLHDEIQGAGFLVEDTPGGTVVRSS